MIGPNPFTPTTDQHLHQDREWSEASGVVEVQDYAAGEDNHAVRSTSGTSLYADPARGGRLSDLDKHWADQPQVTEIIIPITENATRVAALLSARSIS